MRITPIVLIAAASLSSSAFAAPEAVMSDLTGLNVLTTLARALGVTISAVDMTAINATSNAYLRSIASVTLAGQLRLSSQVFARLVQSSGVPVDAQLVTQAVMQATSGQELLTSAVMELLRRHPELLVLNARVFSSLINNAASVAHLNAILEEARTPVTARGGGK